jgi:hypothetical protein
MSRKMLIDFANLVKPLSYKQERAAARGGRPAMSVR